MTANIIAAGMPVGLSLMKTYGGINSKTERNMRRSKVTVGGSLADDAADFVEAWHSAERAGRRPYADLKKDWSPERHAANAARKSTAIQIEPPSECREHLAQGLTHNHLV